MGATTTPPSGQATGRAPRRNAQDDNADDDENGDDDDDADGDDGDDSDDNDDSDRPQRRAHTKCERAELACPCTTTTTTTYHHRPARRRPQSGSLFSCVPKARQSAPHVFPIYGP